MAGNLKVYEPVPPLAKLYLVMVLVHYQLNERREDRLWPVRVVAPNPDKAMRAAYTWAEQQSADGIPDEAARYCSNASVIDIIGSVDCIGSSLQPYEITAAAPTTGVMADEQQKSNNDQA